MKTSDLMPKAEYEKRVAAAAVAVKAALDNSEYSALAVATIRAEPDKPSTIRTALMAAMIELRALRDALTDRLRYINEDAADLIDNLVANVGADYVYKCGEALDAEAADHAGA